MEAVREEEVKLRRVGFVKEVGFKPVVKERTVLVCNICSLQPVTVVRDGIMMRQNLILISTATILMLAGATRELTCVPCCDESRRRCSRRLLRCRTHRRRCRRSRVPPDTTERTPSVGCTLPSRQSPLRRWHSSSVTSRCTGATSSVSWEFAWLPWRRWCQVCGDRRRFGIRSPRGRRPIWQ